MVYMFSWTNRNNHSPQSRRLKNIMESFWQIVSLKVHHVSLCSVGTFSRGCYKQETQRAAKSSGLRKHTRSHRQTREKCASVLVEVVKAFEKEFLFSARKPIFLGMHRFPVWDLLGICYFCIYSFYFFSCFCLFHFLFNPYTTLLSRHMFKIPPLA